MRFHLPDLYTHELIMESLLKRAGLPCDVGFPSVGCEYILLPLVNKEPALGLWLEIRTEVYRESRWSQRDAM